MYTKFFKRFLDIVLSGMAIVVLSPLLLLLAVLVRLDSKGPIFFKQKRVGKGKTHFQIRKFRSMYADTPHDMPTHMLGNAQSHITRVGKVLRVTSLDELPQLFNIFAGQMSIVGPRPALWNQFDLIEERDKYGANDLVPGLTGYAQINGRDEIPIQQKAQLDGWYVQHIGFITDCRIILGTVSAVFTHKGIVEGEHTGKKSG